MANIAHVKTSFSGPILKHGLLYRVPLIKTRADSCSYMLLQWIFGTIVHNSSIKDLISLARVSLLNTRVYTTNCQQDSYIVRSTEQGIYKLPPSSSTNFSRASTATPAINGSQISSNIYFPLCSHPTPPTIRHEARHIRP